MMGLFDGMSRRKEADEKKIEKRITFPWSYVTGGWVNSVSITPDASYVAAGSWDKNVYLLDREGRLLWSYETGDGVWSVAISSDGSYVAAGSSKNRLYLFDREGRLLWSYETGDGVWSVAISSDGSYVAAGSKDNRVYLFDRRGELLWSYGTGDWVNSVSISSDGSYVAAGSGFGDKNVYLLDREGRLLWSCETGNSVSSVAITSDGSYVAAGSGKVYLFDRGGELLWKRETRGGVWSVAITPDGSYVAAGSMGNRVYLLDREGRLLWKHDTGGDVRSVSITSDGSYVAAGSLDDRVYLLDRGGELLWNYETRGWISSVAFVSSVAITPDGSYVAAGSWDKKVYLFRNEYKIKAAQRNAKESLDLAYSRIKEAEKLGINLSGAQDLHKKAILEFDNKAYEKAIEYAEKCKKVAEDEISRYNHAKEQIEASKEIVKGIKKLTPVPEAEELIKNAESALKAGNYSNAVELAKEAEGEALRVKKDYERYKEASTLLSSIESEANRLRSSGIRAPLLDELIRQARSELGKKNFDRSLEIDPGYEEAKNNKKLAEEKLRAQKVRSITPEPSSTSLPALHLSVERTIYDPVTRDFIISKSRALPNVKNWVDRNDPSMYWLVMCVNNSSERAIDEWGIELEMPSTLRVLEAVVEGFEQRFSLRDSSSNPWSTSWTLGIPHHLGIVIPRNGSRRIYFKLASDVCGISYSIKGRIITPDMEIAIKEKQFRYSCDAATLKNAIVSDPEGAEEYTRRILLSTYTRDTAIKLLHSFKLVQEMERCCTIGDYEKIRDKMEILLDVLEGTGAGENLTRLVRKNLEAVRIMGDVESSAERVRRLCGNILDVWINEILKG